ncbi:MAG TPA: hypothetical protein VGB49_01645 [Caulobacteraceae bacterium]|jgi:hypothetical protein
MRPLTMLLIVLAAVAVSVAVYAATGGRFVFFFLPLLLGLPLLFRRR